MREQIGQRVLTLIGEAVFDGHRLRSDLTIGSQDATAVARLVARELDGVARIVAVLVGARHLQHVELREQDHEQRHEHQREMTELAVHGVTPLAPAVSEMRTSSASST